MVPVFAAVRVGCVSFRAEDLVVYLHRFAWSLCRREQVNVNLHECHCSLLCFLHAVSQVTDHEDEHDAILGLPAGDPR